ncbi:hypothetical protein Pcinc_001252 [Petrolisthes cinctipes]|uniref:Uncharacterized protein n=1 Tax=Petrolisthes cinctipes TaxID=88211 RepID=A0AAE1GL50_PETCI|nr:hypothetical protein Pcinc_001252 [Petrolisthes cinctipes]
MQYRFQVRYLPGKESTAADFLSWYPALQSSPAATNADLDEDLAEAVAAAVVASTEHEGYVLDEAAIRGAAADDPVHQLLLVKVLLASTQVAGGGLPTSLLRSEGPAGSHVIVYDLRNTHPITASRDTHHHTIPDDQHQVERLLHTVGCPRATVRLSSAQYTQSIGRAKAAVKSAKRIIRANTGSGGTFDTVRASLAILQYLNSPLQGINKSPAQLAAGRQLRDGVPTASWHLKVDMQWDRTLHSREIQMGEYGYSVALVADSKHRILPPLIPSTRVRVQNQASNMWDRAGVVVVMLPQYTVRLDRHVTLRNSGHLRLTTAAMGEAAPASQRETVPAPQGVPHTAPAPHQPSVAVRSATFTPHSLVGIENR